MTESNYQLRLIDPSDRVNKLKLHQADSALGAFLQRSCLSYHDSFLARTYVYVDADEPPPRRVLAYISVLASEISRENATTPELPNFRYDTYPSLKIGRLAVDLRVQGKGLGKNLVAYSIAVAKREIMPRIGCRFIVVDANQPAIEFYRKCGFVMVDTEENRQRSEPIMFYDLLKVDGS